MKRLQGKIGMQEGISLCALAIVTTSLFTIDSAEFYADGNAGYISVPLSVLIGLLGILPILFAMKKTRSESLSSLLRSALGRGLGAVAALVIIAILFFSALAILSKFVSAVSSFLFYLESGYEKIALWMLATIAVLSFGGFERLGRTAKCFAAFLGICLIIVLLIPIDSYELYRIYPLPGKDFRAIIQDCLSGSIKTLPALLCLCINGQGVHGGHIVRRSSMIACGIGFVLVFAVQLCLGLSFTYMELQELYIPLYRINMGLLTEGYFLRLDKVSLLLWLIGGIITVGFYLYSASLLGLEMYGGTDIRPSLLTGTAILLTIISLAFTEYNNAFNMALGFFENYGFIILLGLLVLIAIIAFLRAKSNKGMEEHA